MQHLSKRTHAIGRAPDPVQDDEQERRRLSICSRRDHRLAGLKRSFYDSNYAFATPMLFRTFDSARGVSP